jgi:RNA polymerase sigma-70 factor (TIGR02943 family)
MKHILNPEAWVELHGDALLRFALFRVADRDTALDLVQDTFVTALRTQAQYRGELSEKNWLFLILRSRILDHCKKKNEAYFSELESEENEDPFFDQKGHWLAKWAPKAWTTDQVVEQNEFMQVFEYCRSKLKALQKTVFTLKHIEEEEAESICKELGLLSSNYWVLMHRARLQLRTCIEVNWFNK